MDQGEALARLYESLASKRAAGPKTVRDMPEDQRRAYMREAKARQRAREGAAVESGSPEPIASVIRDALADAALMLLATEGPGSRQITEVLAKAFPGRPGLPMTVMQKARSGRLKPKLNLQAR